MREIIEALLANGIVKKNEILKIKEISGGNINKIFDIKTKKGNFICKYALETAVKLPQLGKLDRKRLQNEYECILFFNQILKTKKYTSEVVFYDGSRHVLCFKKIDNINNLQDILSKGIINKNIFVKIAQLIAKIHNSTLNNDFLLKHFSSDIFLWAKEKAIYTEISTDIKIEKRARAIGKSINRKICLIHGDFKASNFLIYRDRPIMIDMETAAYGNPAFDVGHLIGVIIRYPALNKELLENYFDVIEAYWKEYKKNTLLKNLSKFEADLISHAGCEVLARMTGIPKEKVYDKKHIKEILIPLAKSMIMGEIKKVKDLKKAFIQNMH